MTRSKLTQAMALVLGGLTFSGIVAAGDKVIDGYFVRLTPTTPSGGGGTVLNNCGGEAYDNASASIMVEQEGGESEVKIKLRNARPNTVYTAWIRLKGADSNGGSYGGSPITGKPPTPLSPSTDVAGMIPFTPPNAGSADLSVVTNAIMTDDKGKGELETTLDFPLIRGAYPFNLVGAYPPVAIANPAEDGIGAPFLLRIVSHCLDGVGHGLLTGPDREPWFDWPQ